MGVDRLAGREDHHPGGAELFFQPQAVEHVTAGAVDVLADHRAERAISGGDGGAQVGHAPVAGDAGGGELAPQAVLAAGVQVDPAGLHVPVAPHDAEPFGQPFAGSPVLAGQGHYRVLQGSGAGPSEERYPDRRCSGVPLGVSS